MPKEEKDLTYLPDDYELTTDLFENPNLDQMRVVISTLLNLQEWLGNFARKYHTQIQQETIPLPVTPHACDFLNFNTDWTQTLTYTQEIINAEEFWNHLNNIADPQDISLRSPNTMRSLLESKLNTLFPPTTTASKPEEEE